MHEVYAEEVLQLAAKTAPPRAVSSLKRLCLGVVSRHAPRLDVKALLELPTSLLKDLLPHLNIHDLNMLQPALNLRGISTYSAWVTILQDIKGAHRVVGLHTEEETKQETMDTCFQLTFYGFKYKGVAKQIVNVNIKSLLLVVARYVRRFYLRPSQFLQTFAGEQRSLLTVLEKSVECVDVKHHKDLLKTESRYALYTLHRLLDHGEAKDLILHGQDPVVLAWILHARGSQHECPPQQRPGRVLSLTAAEPAPQGEDGDGDYRAARKRPRLDVESWESETGKPKSPVEPELLCQTFALTCGRLAGPCPRGQIHSLQLRECGRSLLCALTPFLPTWLCLSSLTLQSCMLFSATEVLMLARSLRQLSETSRSSLVYLSVGVFSQTALVERLLAACPALRSLSVEIHPMAEDLGLPRKEVDEPADLQAALPLEKLSVKVPQVLTDLHSITAVLKRTANLTSLHISGIRLPSSSSYHQLLTSISESNRHLRKLNLEDLNLAGCLHDILGLLRNCMLEELSLKDCRLLEKCSDKELYLQQVVDALRGVASLRSLCLSQNRLAKSSPVLAELFTGSPCSAVRRLDISSNFIQPAELLQLGRSLQRCPPLQRLTLDLRKNPWDRDQETWHAALRTLRPLADFLTDGWKSTGTMADHISNM